MIANMDRKTSLNTRGEIMSKCRHRDKVLLVNYSCTNQETRDHQRQDYIEQLEAQDIVSDQDQETPGTAEAQEPGPEQFKDTPGLPEAQGHDQDLIQDPPDQHLVQEFEPEEPPSWPVTTPGVITRSRTRAINIVLL